MIDPVSRPDRPMWDDGVQPQTINELIQARIDGWLSRRDLELAPIGANGVGDQSVNAADGGSVASAEANQPFPIGEDPEVVNV